METSRQSFFKNAGVTGAGMLSGSLTFWNCIAPLSEWSVANRSDSIQVPDFTCGSYQSNKPVDISLSQGGNTGVRAIITSSGYQLIIKK